VGADADGNIVFLHDLEGLDDMALLVLVVPDVTGAAPEVGGRGALFQMFDQQFLVLVDVGCDDVGDPLHPPAPFVPVARQAHVLEVVVLQDDTVDAALFAKPQRLQHTLLGVVPARQLVHIEQIPRVHVRADQIAAAEQATQGELADLPRGHLVGLGSLCHRIPPA